MVIAISGKKGSGKTEFSLMLQCLIEAYKDNREITFAQYLNYKEQFDIYGNINNLVNSNKAFQFAEPIKQIASIITGCSQKKLEIGNFKKELSNYHIDMFNEDKYITYRELLIHIGDMFRKDNPYIFAEIAVRKIKDYLYYNHNCIALITDLRFREELDCLLKYKAIKNDILKLIRIERKDLKDVSNDKSEIDLDNVLDGFEIIDNNEDLESLYNKAKNVVKNIFKYGN